MAIDDSQLTRSPNDSGNSQTVAAAVIHRQSKARREGMPSQSGKRTASVGNSQDVKAQVELTNIDDIYQEEATDDRARLTQKDIDDLKAELRRAQDEAKKARIEFEEGRRKLEPEEETSEIPQNLISVNMLFIFHKHLCHSSLHVLNTTIIIAP